MGRMKKTPMLIISALLVLVLLSSGCMQADTGGSQNPPPSSIGGEKPTVEKSRELAENFVTSSSTYMFDGYGLSHNQTLVLDCNYCWKFVFRFSSRHTGYGDRTGMVLAEVITPHTAVVFVRGGVVETAALDEKWDMMSKKYLGNGGDGFCGISTNAQCDSDSGCTTGGCSGQVCQARGERITTTCEFRECYDETKYGFECRCIDGQCKWYG